MMFRKIGWLLVLGGVLSALGELLLLQLPTLRWPFDVSRELGWLNAGGEEGPLLWFGWLSVMLMIGGGVTLLIKFPRGFQFTPITQRRIDRFCSIKRGHRAFVIVGVLALIAGLDQLIVGNEPLLMKYDGRYYSPALERYYETSESGDHLMFKGRHFGLSGDAAESKPDYRLLNKSFAEQGGGDWLQLRIPSGCQRWSSKYGRMACFTIPVPNSPFQDWQPRFMT